MNKFQKKNHNREDAPDLLIKRKVREINDHVLAGKPCYWDKSPGKRLRVFRARVSKGRFQILPIAGQRWMDAQLGDNFELCR